MIKLKFKVNDNWGFYTYNFEVHCTFHEGSIAEVKNGYPIECDSDAFLDIHKVFVDNTQCTIDAAAEWAEITPEELETIIKEKVEEHLDLPF